MKKLIHFMCVMTLITTGIFAQVSANPADEFYTNALTWEIKGLVPHLPQIRPYPLQVVEDILQTVIEGDNDTEAELAKSEYQRIFGRAYHARVSGGYTATYSKDTGRKDFIPMDFSVYGDKKMFPWINIGYQLGAYVLKGGDYEFDYLPAYTNVSHDSLADRAPIKGFSCFTDVNTVISFGNTSFYGNGGISRFGFGPFPGSGIALNDTDFHMAGLSGGFKITPKFNFSTFYASICATNNEGGGHDSNKYLALHSIDWDMFNNFSVSFYEAALFGGRPEFSYLLPVPYLVSECLNGIHDNIWMGVIAEFRPVNTLKFAFDFFVDDFAIRKFSLDDKYRFAAQMGAQWAPNTPVIKLMTLDYTAVMPYVYTHGQVNNYTENKEFLTNTNYQNYTHYGMSLGATIPPNSDRLSFKASLKPVSFLTVETGFSFARHQNVNEVLSQEEKRKYVLANPKNGVYLTDGGIFNHPEQYNGTEYGHMDSYQYHLLFMKGEHTQLNFTFDLNTVFSLPQTKFGTLSFKAGYTFEYIKNNGVNRNMYPSYFDSYIKNGDGSYTWQGQTYADLKLLGDAMIAYSDAIWLSGLTDTVNHYLTLAIEYKW